MKQRTITIFSLVLSIVVVCTTIVKTTYAFINNITNNIEYNTENIITIREVITDELGIYTNEYYNLINELEINSQDADIIIDSEKINKALNDILIEEKRLSNKEIYNIIRDAINNDKTINNELKNKLISKLKIYYKEIANYIYQYKYNKKLTIT